jgi:hypothetical protein
MDPNANLAEQDQLLCAIQALRSDTDDRRRLRDLREALTEWIADGGFAPQWDRYPVAAAYFLRGRQSCITADRRHR